MNKFIARVLDYKYFLISFLFLIISLAIPSCSTQSAIENNAVHNSESTPVDQKEIDIEIESIRKELSAIVGFMGDKKSVDKELLDSIQKNGEELKGSSADGLDKLKEANIALFEIAKKLGDISESVLKSGLSKTELYDLQKAIDRINTGHARLLYWAVIASSSRAGAFPCCYPTQDGASFEDLLSAYNNGGVFSINLILVILAIITLAGGFVKVVLWRDFKNDMAKEEAAITKSLHEYAAIRSAQIRSNLAFNMYNIYSDGMRRLLETIQSRYGERREEFQIVEDVHAGTIPENMEIDLHQYISHLSQAVIFSVEALKEVKQVSERSVVKDNKQKALVMCSYISCNLLYYSVEMFRHSTDPNEKVKYEVQASEYYPDVEEIVEKEKDERKDHWYHTRESQLHAYYFLNQEDLKSSPALRQSLKLNVDEIIKYAIARSNSGWATKFRTKWDVLQNKLGD